MTVARLGSNSIGSAAQNFGLGFDAVDRVKFSGLIGGTRCSYVVVNELHAIARATYLTRTLGKAANAVPLDVAGHPALSTAGLVDGLPEAMMLSGKHFDDDAVLRVGRTFEKLHGGFPAPSSATSLASA